MDLHYQIVLQKVEDGHSYDMFGFVDLPVEECSTTATPKKSNALILSYRNTILKLI